MTLVSYKSKSNKKYQRKKKTDQLIFGIILIMQNFDKNHF